MASLKEKPHSILPIRSCQEKCKIVYTRGEKRSMCAQEAWSVTPVVSERTFLDVSVKEFNGVLIHFIIQDYHCIYSMVT